MLVASGQYGPVERSAIDDNDPFGKIDRAAPNEASDLDHSSLQ